MNKNKIIMISAGGLALVAMLAVGYLSFDAISQQNELEAEIEGLIGDIEGTINDKNVAPTSDEVKKIEAETEKVTTWHKDALDRVCVGDLAPETGLTDSVLRDRFSDDISKLRSECKIDFEDAFHKEGFVFKRFIEGEMPERAKLEEYARQWADVTMLVRALDKCGVARLESITLNATKSAPVVEDKSAKNNKSRRKRNNKKEAPVAEAKAESALDQGPYSEQTFVLVYHSRPAPHIKFLNMISTYKTAADDADESFRRFVTTSYLSFKHLDTQIEKSLIAKDKDSKDDSRSKKTEEDKPKTGFVYDVTKDGMLEVSLSLATVDFKTGKSAVESANDEPATEEEAK